jgi:hypothetical protein
VKGNQQSFNPMITSMRCSLSVSAQLPAGLYVESGSKVHGSIQPQHLQHLSATLLLQKNSSDMILFAGAACSARNAD